MGLSGDAALRWIAREPRPGFGTLGGSFWVGLSARPGEVLALSTSALFRVVMGPAVAAPTIDLGRAAVSVRAEPGGDPATVLLQVGNLGDEELAVRIAGAEPADRFRASILGLPGAPGADPNDPLCLRVPPGPSVGAFEIVFSPADEATVAGSLVLETNDPDQTDVVVPVSGNPTALAVGGVAPDFALPALDGSLVRLGDYAGDVVLLKFFNFQ